jgi:hypothetical protein
MRPRIWISIVAILLAGSSAITWRKFQDSKPTQPPPLTAELAKSALISLIESKDSGEFESFPLDKWRAVDAAVEGDWTHWGPITLKIGERTYEFTWRSGPETRLCVMHFRGTFELQGGEWTAAKPECYQTELRAGSSK